MTLFKEQMPELSDELKNRDPMDAIPRLREGVDCQRDNTGQIQLRFVIPPKNFIEKFFGQTLNFSPPTRINLDLRGSDFVDAMDAKRTIRALAKFLAKKWDCKPEEANAAVLGFTKSLMRRNMIQLELKI
ncbi:MAG: PqqD family peptide modification chaperone [Lentisphaeria bacterium]|nr:hypothetical protein [Lentisphaeria bacterium]NQZ69935.1 PqqD family peptide modification chaperone [Lentisphaeria bacterium]